MYRAGVEWILGFRLRGSRLVIDPCIPRAWGAFEIAFRYHSSLYEIQVNNPTAVSRGVVNLEMDGAVLSPPDGLDLVDDGSTHKVSVTLG
jgi:cyclic beta-1,2-glucan synthetase